MILFGCIYNENLLLLQNHCTYIGIDIDNVVYHKTNQEQTAVNIL